MITIRPIYNRNKITFSNPGSGWRGFSVMANNIAEIRAALSHYRMEKHNKRKCPLCRLEQQEKVR